MGSKETAHQNILGFFRGISILGVFPRYCKSLTITACIKLALT